VVQIEHDHGIFVANLELLALMLHIARAQMRVHVDGDFAGGNFTPDFVNANAVLAAEALGAHVDFARTFAQFAFNGVRIAKAHAATDCARFAGRADGAARFFNRNINIRVARP
jgi:hypothetical protein